MKLMRTTVASIVAATLSMTAVSAFAAASLTGAGATFPAPVYASGQILIRKKQVTKLTIKVSFFRWREANYCQYC